MTDDGTQDNAGRPGDQRETEEQKKERRMQELRRAWRERHSSEEPEDHKLGSGRKGSR